MSVNLHTTRVHKVEYGCCPVNGWEDIEKFLEFLRDKQRKGMQGIYISENEENIEIDFKTLKKLKRNKTWRDVIQAILDDSDKSNECAILYIW